MLEYTSPRLKGTRPGAQTDTGKSERLDKIIANNTTLSRADARRAVRSGRVTVNGEVARKADAKVRAGSDRVAVDGEPLEPERNAYFMMNKAAGDVCSAVSDRRSTVYERLSPGDVRRYAGGVLSTAGRLDADAEGLLIITSDGDLIHKITSPKNEVPKTYLVRLRAPVGDGEAARYERALSSGVHIASEGKAPAADCRPCAIEWGGDMRYDSDAGAARTVCRLTVTEGKFHEVKRIFRALGNEVARLKRIRIGGLWLDGTLDAGAYRALGAEEIALLLEKAAPGEEK